MAAITTPRLEGVLSWEEELDEVVAVVTKWPHYFEGLDRKFQVVSRVAWAAVMADEKTLQYVDAEMRASIRNEIFNAIEKISENDCEFKTLNARLQGVRSVAACAIAKDGWNLRYVSATLKKDPGLVSLALRISEPYVITFADKRFREKPKLAMEMVRIQGLVLGHLSEECRNNWHIVLAAVRQNSLAVEHVGESLMCDRKIWETAMQNKSQYVQGELREIILSLSPAWSECIQKMIKEIASTKE